MHNEKYTLKDIFRLYILLFTVSSLSLTLSLSLSLSLSLDQGSGGELSLLAQDRRATFLVIM